MENITKGVLMRFGGGQNFLVQVKQEGIEGGAMGAVQEQLILELQKKKLKCKCTDNGVILKAH